jgi:hypothetical protein
VLLERLCQVGQTMCLCARRPCLVRPPVDRRRAGLGAGADRPGLPQDPHQQLVELAASRGQEHQGVTGICRRHRPQRRACDGRQLLAQSPRQVGDPVLLGVRKR